MTYYAIHMSGDECRMNVALLPSKAGYSSMKGALIKFQMPNEWLLMSQ